MKSTADISGTTGANFTFTIDSATILAASLKQPIPSLPAGISTVRLDLVWAPQDPDATIDVGTVTSGTVRAAAPKHTIDADDVPGFVVLFGE